MRFFKRPQYKWSRATSNIMISLGVAAALVLILWQAGVAVIFNNFPVDRSGNVAPVAVFGGTGGVFTGVSSVDPLPVTLGAPTASTDPLGWGQAFFPSNVKGGQAGDCTIESALNIVCKEPTASVNALNSTDGGRIYKQLSTGLLAGSVHTVAHTVGGGVLYMTGSLPATNFRRSTNSGSTWIVAGTPPPVTGLATMQACRSSATVSLCVGSDALNSSIWRSTDLGVTWARPFDVIGTGLPTGQNFCGIENTTGTTWIALICSWVGGVGTSEGDIYESLDDGSTWAFKSSTLSAAGYGPLNGAGLTKVLTLGGVRHMLALSGNTIFRSTDDGATWTPIFTKSGTKLFIKAVDMGTGIWVAFAALPAAAGREIYRSVNDGLTWTLAWSDGSATSSARTPPDYSLKGDSSSGVMVMNTNTGSNATAFWYSRPVQSGEVRPVKAFTIFSKHDTCGVVATLVSAANSAKRDVMITNRGTGSIFVGGLGVSTSTGHEVSVGGSFVVDLFEGDFFCIASPAQTVHVTEVLD